MFGFEGLGSIYWHMVSKLLLAVQEVYFAAADAAENGSVQQLGELYYRVRQGLGFNKSPAEFGAFPTDPYSHTPGHSGAKQPGMTGQVKEEILTRFGELGVRVKGGRAWFNPQLLRRREFVTESRPYCYLATDGSWNEIEVPANALAFTICQVPVVYRLGEDGSCATVISYSDDTEKTLEQLDLSAEDSAEVFDRSGRIRKLTITFGPELLFAD